MKRLLKLKMVSFMALMLAFGWLSAQNAAPAGYPTLERPTDSNAEGTGFDEAKQAWINANPAEYQKLVDGKATLSTNDANRQMTETEKNKFVAENPALYNEMAKPLETRTTFTRDELKQLPLEKQQAILNDSKFTIIETK